MRKCISALSNSALAASLTIGLMGAAQVAKAEDSLIETVKMVEAQLDARIGVAMRDLTTGATWEYRADERFPMSSTFKSLACGAVLARADAGADDLQRRIEFSEGDLVSYSPVTEKNVQTGMTLGELCEATITISDNTAGNLVLKAIDGPEGLTAFLRSIGDSVTRLDRWETDLNEAVPGDQRDTTTPNAMLTTLNELAFGTALSKGSQDQLIAWSKSQKVADALIRASLPTGWEIGDKSGAGGFGSRSITAIIWPPETGPVLAAIYMTENEADFPTRNAAIAEIGAAMVAAIEAQ